MPRSCDWTPEAEQQLRQLWRQGLSFKAIGAEMGVSKSAISGKCFRLDLPARPRPEPKPKAAPAPLPVPEPPDVADRLRCVWVEGERHSYVRCPAPKCFGSVYCRTHRDRAYHRRVELRG